MNAIDPAAPRCRCLRVLPRSRGSWIVATEQAVLSEHATATEAENAALAGLRDGDELLVVDRCHRRARPDPAHASSSPQISRQGWATREHRSIAPRAPSRRREGPCLPARAVVDYSQCNCEKEGPRL
jgi:hypothetical protein